MTKSKYVQLKHRKAIPGLGEVKELRPGAGRVQTLAFDGPWLLINGTIRVFGGDVDYSEDDERGADESVSEGEAPRAARRTRSAATQPLPEQ